MVASSRNWSNWEIAMGGPFRRGALYAAMWLQQLSVNACTRH
jgi:hypothetical protein